MAMLSLLLIGCANDKDDNIRSITLLEKEEQRIIKEDVKISSQQLEEIHWNPEYGKFINRNIKWNYFPTILDDYVISIYNPYRNYTYYHKGQIHFHTSDSDAEIKPKTAATIYRNIGYDFVVTSDHDSQIDCEDIISWGDYLKDLVIIRGQEGGKGRKRHLLEIGLYIEYPFNYLETCRRNSFELVKNIAFVEMQGGVAVAPHPCIKRINWWSRADRSWRPLYSPYLRGLEIRENCYEHHPSRVKNHKELWDYLLIRDVTRWGFASDDSHMRPDSPGSFNRVNKGFIMVNSDISPEEDSSHYKYVKNILDNMRHGNFYSVINRPSNYNPERVPEIISITTAGEDIILKTRFASEVMFITGKNKRISYMGDEKSYDIREVKFKCSGDERFVRIELTNNDGIQVLTQPLFIYGKSSERCREIDYESVRLKLMGMFYVLAYHNLPIIHFHDKRNAERALELLKHYRAAKWCATGPSDYESRMEYFLDENGLAPAGAFAGETCEQFDPKEVDVVLNDNTVILNNKNLKMQSWDLMWLEKKFISFNENVSEAYRTKEIIQKHEFNMKCNIGNMTYYRK
jgi:hypothetical protein